MSPHEELANMVVDADLDGLASPTLHALYRTILDTVGCAAAAATDQLATDVTRANAAFGSVEGTYGCVVIGSDRRLPPAAAAMVNATLAHGFDFDDVHLPSVAHFSALVVPAAMAACEMFGAGGREFLEAVLVGDEVGGTIGAAACSEEWGGSSVRAHGFFPTSVVGTMAAAAAVAKVGRFSVEQTSQALAVAASYASGVAAVSRGDSSTKPTQAGWAAMAGLSAALHAHAGFTGPRDVLDTRQGFWEAFTGRRFDAAALDRTGESWVCEEMSVKLYPAEYIIHPLIEQAAEAGVVLGDDLKAVTEISAAAPSSFRTLFAPKDVKTTPRHVGEALMSAPYCIALTLAKRSRAGMTMADVRDWQPPDELTQQLALLVEHEQDDVLDRAFPEHVGGRLTLRAGRSVVWEGTVPDVFGSLARPMTDDQLVAKFRSNGMCWSESRQTDVLDLLRELADQRDATWLTELGA